MDSQYPSRRLPQNAHNSPPRFPALGGRHEPPRALPDGVRLIAREDIFAAQGGRAVLLARAGMAVSEELLPKLIRYGAEPSQFVLEETATPATGTRTALPRVSALPDMRSTPMSTPSSPPAATTRNWQSLVVVEPDDRAFRRLNDALSLCGVRSRDVHVTRSAGHLPDMLASHAPSVLMVSDSIHPASSMMAYLRRLQSACGIERVALMSGLSRAQERERQQLLLRAEEAGIHVLFRPITPFSLTPLLCEYRARLAMIHRSRDDA